MQGKAEDAGGLTPAKDDNAAMRPLYPRAFARNSDDCYKHDTGMIVLCTSIMMLHEIHLQGSTSAGVFFQWHSQQNYLLCPVAKNFIRSLLTKLTQSSILYAEHIFEYNN